MVLTPSLEQLVSTPKILRFFGHDVRRVGSRDDPWLVATDIGRALDVSDFGTAVRAFASDEKGMQPVLVYGSKHELLCLSEPGLYRFMAELSSLHFEPFKRWLFHDVLPAIHRTGTYTDPTHPATSKDGKAERADEREVATLKRSLAEATARCRTMELNWREAEAENLELQCSRVEAAARSRAVEAKNAELQRALEEATARCRAVEAKSVELQRSLAEAKARWVELAAVQAEAKKLEEQRKIAAADAKKAAAERKRVAAEAKKIQNERKIAKALQKAGQAETKKIQEQRKIAEAPQKAAQAETKKLDAQRKRLEAETRKLEAQNRAHELSRAWAVDGAGAPLGDSPVTADPRSDHHPVAGTAPQPTLIEAKIWAVKQCAVSFDDDADAMSMLGAMLGALVDGDRIGNRVRQLFAQVISTPLRGSAPHANPAAGQAGDRHPLAVDALRELFELYRNLADTDLRDEVGGRRRWWVPSETGIEPLAKVLGVRSGDLTREGKLDAETKRRLRARVLELRGVSLGPLLGLPCSISLRVHLGGGWRPQAWRFEVPGLPKGKHPARKDLPPSRVVPRAGLDEVQQ